MKKKHHCIVQQCLVKQACDGQGLFRSRTLFSNHNTQKQAHPTLDRSNYLSPNISDHFNGGINKIGSAKEDCLKDMAQTNILLVILDLSWNPDHRPLHSINLTLSSQSITHQLTLGDQDTVQKPQLGTSEPSRTYWRDSTLVSFLHLLFSFTLISAFVTFRNAKSRASEVALPLAHLSALSAPPPFQYSPVIPSSSISKSICCAYSLSTRPLDILSSATRCGIPFYSYYSSKTGKSIAGFIHSPARYNSPRIRDTPSKNAHKFPTYYASIFNIFTYRTLSPIMARSEDCLHCADLQAELEEIRTQQTVLDDKQKLLDARLE